MCILLVFIKQVYHDARSRKCAKSYVSIWAVWLNCFTGRVSFMWLCNLHSHTKGRTQAEGFRRKGADEDIWD